LVPVTFLPVPLRLASRAFFLSWGADLLRDAYSAPTVANLPFRLAVVTGLGAAGFVLGNGLVTRSLSSLRASGRLSLR
ncbi:MAG: ABC transporter permease, partial [Acidimicrobiia bacterium]